jgi:glycosyltransferase involved in cell wall biosynthesis
MSRLRLAFFSPFNPQKTGVSDYSEELLPHLADKADIDLVTGPYKLSNSELTKKFRILSAQQFLSRADAYDMPIYQIANNVYQHEYMVPCMLAHPGVSVFHDYYLHFLMLGLTALRGDFDALKRILHRTYGEKSTGLAYRLLLSIEDPYAVSLVQPLIDASRAIVTHSQYARSLVFRDRPDKLLAVIPMGMPENPFVAQRNAMRAKHGFKPDEFVAASVTTLSHTKRLEVVLSALSRLKDKHANLRLLVLGAGRAGERVRKLIAREGLQSRVHFTGWCSSEHYAQLLVASDIVIDMRFPSGAETSASLLRALSAATPAIVSDQGSFAELPDALALKIPVGSGEDSRLAEALTMVISDRPRRTSMGIAALEYAKSNLKLEDAAHSYVETVQRALKVPSVPTEDVWDFAANRSSLKCKAWSGVYKLSRGFFLCRKYGWADALRRFKSEDRARRTGLPQSTGVVE